MSFPSDPCMNEWRKLGGGKVTLNDRICVNEITARPVRAGPATELKTYPADLTVWSVGSNVVPEHRSQRRAYQSGRDGPYRTGDAMRVLLPALAFGLSVQPSAATQSMQVPAATVSGTALQTLLKAGAWTEQADDEIHGERLPAAEASALGTSAGSASRTASEMGDLGVLVLALSVAEWGVEGPPPVSDPAKKGWSGPNMLGGKHLMSYTAGGIGIPHLDVEVALPFFDQLGRLLPAAAPEAAELRHAGANHGVFHFDVVRAQGGICSQRLPKPTLMTDLDGERFSEVGEHYAGQRYCSRFAGDARLDPKAWQRLRHWSRVGLRRRDMQAWVVQDWVTKQWLQAYNTVLDLPHGSLAEAFIIARIRNSSPALARAALSAAAGETDPSRRIGAELRRYADASETNRCRAGVMQRPAALLGLIVVPTDAHGCLPKGPLA